MPTSLILPRHNSQECGKIYAENLRVKQHTTGNRESLFKLLKLNCSSQDRSLSGGVRPEVEPIYSVETFTCPAVSSWDETASGQLLAFQGQCKSFEQQAAIIPRQSAADRDSVPVCRFPPLLSATI